MADRPPIPDGPFDESGSAAGDSHPGMPAWFKAAIAVVVVVVALLVIGKLAGVEHGPGMHGGNGRTVFTKVSEDEATPPAAPGDQAPVLGLDPGQR